jgi:glycosyltransferase involved in cell wall biosynthesis
LGILARAQVVGLAGRPRAWLAAAQPLAASPSRVVAASWLRGVALAPAARDLGVTHFHAHFATGANVAAMVLGRLTGMPFSFTTHAVDLYARPVLLCETLAAARFGVTSTAYNQGFLRERCGAAGAKVALVRACVDPGEFARVVSEPHAPPVVLAVGRYIEKKGLADLVAASATLAGQGIDCRTVIVGDGPERPALAAAIATAGLGTRVELHPPVTQDTLRGLYARADIVALPCVVAADGDRDGIPVSLIEALAVGLPVVSTTVSGIPELVTPDVGLLVPPHDPPALAEALAALLTDPARRARLGAAGPARVRQHFDVSTSAASMAALFAGADPARLDSAGPSSI